jgi:hypothetical protein
VPAILQLRYAARYDRGLLCCDKHLTRRQIPPQAVPSIIGATQKRRDAVFSNIFVFSVT